MFKYNAKTNRFEFVSAEEYEKELLNNSLERELKKTINPGEPIRIEFKMEDSFEVKQSDFDENKNKKDRCVEESMASIDEILSGKHFRAIRGAIEQQIRRAYKQGYCDGIDDAPGEDDAKNEGRKEVWDMVRRLYLADEVENAYDLADLQKAFGTVTFSEILLEDVHEVLAKDKERLKRIEGEKIIRPGDEVEVDPAPLSDSYKGWVADAQKSSVGKARWITQVKNYVEQTWCSKCGKNAPFVFVTDDHYGNHAHGETVKTRFCPNCGKRMENSI